MHTYTKKYIDNLFTNAVFNDCEVSVIKLTAEDITNLKLKLIKNKGNTPKEDDNTIKDDDNTLQVDKPCKNKQTSKDDKKSKVVKTSKDNNTTIDDEPVKKKQKIDTTGIDVLKLVLSREGETDQFKSQFKSVLKPNKENASSSTDEVPIIIDCDETTKSENSSTKDVKPRIWVIDAKKMMNEINYNKWMKCIHPENELKHPTNGLKELTVGKPSSSGPKPSTSGCKPSSSGPSPSSSGPSPSSSRPSPSSSRPTPSSSRPCKNDLKGNLIEIENVYKKYFIKSVQDSIVTIANILNIISMSNKYHKSRMDESFKKNSEAEKLKERCDANELHGRHKKILETKLKNNFTNIVSSFEEEPKFDSAFQMLFLGILTVLRVLDQPKFKKGSIFKNLVLLLWNSLKNSGYNHPRIFAMFRSKTFRPDCIDLITLIEDSRDTDPGVTDRMSLFFVSTVNSREYFQAVINAVTSDSNEDLELLIDNATSQCSIFSKFKDPVDSSIVQHSNFKIPVTQTVPSSINSDKIVQQWFLAKNPDGTYQEIPVSNGNKSQTIGNTGLKHSIVTSQPKNNFCESFPSSIQKNASEPSTSKVIPTKKCFVVASTISNSPLVQVTASSSESATSTPTPTTSTPTTSTFVTFKKPIQNTHIVANSPLHRVEGGTIVLGNKHYQLVKGPSGQMRAVNGTNILVKSPPTIITKCHVRKCKKSATIMCSNCTSVKYCSHECQRTDWYESHISDCDELQNNKKTRL